MPDDTATPQTDGLAPRLNFGVRVAGLLVFAGALMLDVNWCRSVLPGGFRSLAGYIGSTAILLVAMVGFSIVLTPRVAWRALAMVLVVAIGWGVAALLGTMFASCDVNMRPFLGQFLLLLPMSILIWSTGIAAIVAFSGVAALIAWGTGKLYRRRISSWLFLGLLGAVPVIFFLTVAALSTGGVRPVPGNCVI
jgi:hypothetical protein